MKSKIKFEIHLSTNEVPFLDVTVSLKHGKLRTTLFTKPTDFHFYLNIHLFLLSITCSKNIPKRQFTLIATYMFTKIGLFVEQ